MLEKAYERERFLEHGDESRYTKGGISLRYLGEALQMEASMTTPRTHRRTVTICPPGPRDEELALGFIPMCDKLPAILRRGDLYEPPSSKWGRRPKATAVPEEDDPGGPPEVGCDLFD